MSIHTWKSQAKAASLGGFAGDRLASDLWKLSKRELIEIALRLTVTDDVAEAVKRVAEERDALRNNGII